MAKIYKQYQGWIRKIGFSDIHGGLVSAGVRLWLPYLSFVYETFFFIKFDVLPESNVDIFHKNKITLLP